MNVEEKKIGDSKNENMSKTFLKTEHSRMNLANLKKPWPLCSTRRGHLGMQYT
jgi:hypothetical protein